MKSLFYLIIATMLVATACDSKKPADETTGTTAEAKPAEGAEGQDGPAVDENGHVVVSKTGTVFKPPVEKSQIPPGAWICDMGTVEYARMEKGDGKCPECGMFLKQYQGEAAKTADEGAAAGDGHGHEGHGHDDHGHDDGHDHGSHDHGGHDDHAGHAH
jgi:hypothetical protein